MPNQHDFGLVVVETDTSNATTVSICARVENGRPVATFAQYVNPPGVKVHPEVRLTRAGSGQVSDVILEVYSDTEGVVHLRAPRA